MPEARQQSPNLPYRLVNTLDAGYTSRPF